MDVRLRRAMVAFKASPTEYNAMRWATLAAKIDDFGVSGKKIVNLKPHMAHCYNRLIRGLTKIGLGETYTIEELLVIDILGLILRNGVGYNTQRLLFLSLMKEGFKIPTEWATVISGLYGHWNSLRKAREDYEIYNA